MNDGASDRRTRRRTAHDAASETSGDGATLTDDDGRAALLREVDRLLEAHFGPLEPRPSAPPLDVLVQTILSQNTTDTNTRRAFQNLRAAFPTWSLVRDAPASAIEDAIRSAGLARTKAPRIGRILRALDAAGDPTLAGLSQMDDDAAEAYLESFTGVGPKTARCVLLFALGRDVFPIDTHILRILRRLGALHPDVGAARAHREIVPLVPPGRARALHLRLIALGRRICRPRKPACEACPLRGVCPYARSDARS